MKIRKWAAAGVAAALFGAGWASAQTPPPVPAGNTPAPAMKTPVMPAPATTTPASPPNVVTAYPGATSTLPPGAIVTTDGVVSGEVSAALSGQDFDAYSQPYTYYGGAEFILWKMRNPQVPFLVTNVPIGVIRYNSFDEFRDVNTNVLIARQPNPEPIQQFVPVSFFSTATPPNAPETSLGEHTGARVHFGFWFDQSQWCGLETSFFWTERRSQNFQATSANAVNQFLFNTGANDNIFLVTPATATEPATQALSRSFPIFFVREATANVTGSVSSQAWGGELNARTNCVQIGALTIGALTGFRYLDYHEDLNVINNVALFSPRTLTGALLIGDPVTNDPSGNNSQGLPRNSSLPDPIIFTTRDSIRTYNQFYGAQIGLTGEVNWGCLYFNAIGKAAVGGIRQTVDILNSTTSTTFGVPSTRTGGLLTAPNDAGQYSRNRISWVPEVNLRLGYALTPGFRLYMGYNAIYIDQVVRPAGQIGLSNIASQINIGPSTRDINLTQPSFRFRDQNMWIEGISFGGELRY